MALVSIVVPVYNEAPNLPALTERLAALASANARHAFEFIYVDDGSGDDSFAVLGQFAAQDDRIRVIKLTRNFGSFAAILAGMTYASGDCVGFIAADLQDPPETLSEMLGRWEAGYKVVLALRKERRGDPWPTRLFANVFNRLFRKLVFEGFPPQGVGFFLVDRQVADLLVQCSEKNAHLIGLILWSGFQYSVVEYDRAKRIHGTSGWTFQKKIKFFIDAFAAFSSLPLRLSSSLGLCLVGLGGLSLPLVILLGVLSQMPVPGWAWLMVVVLLTSGTQLVMLGVIGEYLWRTLDESRRRPPFVVESVLDFRDGEPGGTGL